ncbi:unnamed protein product [Ceratitis capitata]|uniref:(Mediterranean fruit fly) hypothetical protein n=1 Tax=Ceratitis capitata TaxID=7213 RepID=A0A811U129_CERCA|nr:unnamed protein product [Ceratitis capitata]
MLTCDMCIYSPAVEFLLNQTSSHHAELCAQRNTRFDWFRHRLRDYSGINKRAQVSSASRYFSQLEIPNKPCRFSPSVLVCIAFFQTLHTCSA